MLWINKYKKEHTYVFNIKDLKLNVQRGFDITDLYLLDCILNVAFI